MPEQQTQQLTPADLDARRSARDALYPRPHNPFLTDVIDVARWDAFDAGWAAARVGRAATHSDPKEDAILAAWQATSPALRSTPWLAFRSGMRAVAASPDEGQRLDEVLIDRAEWDRLRRADGFAGFVAALGKPIGTQARRAITLERLIEKADAVAASLPADDVRRLEILAYVEETLDEHNAPKTDGEGRVLSANGRLVDLLAAVAGPANGLRELINDLAFWFDDLGEFAPAGAADLQERVEAVQARLDGTDPPPAGSSS